MAYNENIPQSSDNPSQSQSQILGNFQEISTAFNLNHGNFNAADQGKHVFMQMPEQTTPPTTALNEGALYTKDTGVAPQLFWRNEANGTEQQFTNTVPGVSGSNRNWDFADGQQIRMGTASHGGTSTFVIFSTPFANEAFVVILTPIGAAGLTTDWNAQGLTVNGFTIGSTSSGGGNSFYYLAIGR